MRVAILAAVLGLLASRLAGEVEIRRSGDRLSLMAVAAPLADVLDRLAWQTGMKVVYDAQPPRQLISARLELRTPAEAVLGIMEGLGFNYALVMDPGGARVDQLLILGPVGIAPPAPAPSPTPAPPARRNQRMPPGMDEQGDEPPEDEFEEKNVPPAQATPAPDSPASPSPAAPAPPGVSAPVPPDYPSSSFTPKLPAPATPPPPTPPPGGRRVPVPRPSPTPP